MIRKPFALLVFACCHGARPPLVGAAQPAWSPYLKEIMMGRCYDTPPFPVNKHNGSQRASDLCPDIVGSFMNIIESHLDAEIHPSSFDAYLEQVDVSSQKDRSIFYLKFMGSEDLDNNFVGLPGFTTPEDTPGGALLKDLIFCGVDQVSHCSVENSNAYWSFWQALYSKFSAQVSGRLQIVIESEYSDVQFLIRSIVPQLQFNVIDSVILYDGGRSCGDQRIALLKNALQEQVGFEVKKITCKDYDPLQFYLDNQNGKKSPHGDAADNEGVGSLVEQDEGHDHVPIPAPMVPATTARSQDDQTEAEKQIVQENEHREEAAPLPATPTATMWTRNNQEEEEEEHHLEKEKDSNTEAFAPVPVVPRFKNHKSFLLVIAAISAFACICRSGRKKGFDYNEELIRNLIRIQCENSQDLLTSCLGFRHGGSGNGTAGTDPSHGAEDAEKAASERSPLMGSGVEKEKSTIPPEVSFVVMQ